MVLLYAFTAALAIDSAPGAGGERPAPESADVLISNMEVFDRGAWTMVPDEGSVRVSSTESRHGFRFAAQAPSAVRYRYRLDGRDLAWRLTHNTFRLEIRFLDAVEQLVTSDQVNMQGTSPGWSGSLETSTLTPHHEVVTVPQRACFLRVSFVSGGRPNEVGLLAVRKFKVTRLGADGSVRDTLMETYFEEGDRLDESNGVPQGWQRQGTSGTIAQIRKLPGKESRVFLVLADTDSQRWGVWATSSSGQIPVKPGQRLAIEWLGMYSEGTAGQGEATYPRLPAGTYRFRVQPLRPFGEPAGPERSLILDVRLPFWQTNGFLGLGVVGIVAAVAWTVRHLTSRYLQRQLALSERKSALERERARIARDIHDDLGANLTQIALLSELAQADLAVPEQASLHLNQIFTTAHGLARQLEEIVWAINPANDSLDNLTNYLCKFSQEFLSAARISCRFDIPPTIPCVFLSVLERHNVFLATKESLHNVVKHAEASEVWLRMGFSGGKLRIEIEDNGRGISAAIQTTRSGKGLANIKDRIEKIGGRVEWQDRHGGGMRVRLEIPLAGMKE